MPWRRHSCGAGDRGIGRDARWSPSTAPRPPWQPPSRCSKRSPRCLPRDPIRIGLATGDVTWRTARASARRCGLAAALLERAQPGQILVSNVVRWSAVSGAATASRRSGPIADRWARRSRSMPFAVEWEPLDADAERRSDERAVVGAVAGGARHGLAAAPGRSRGRVGACSPRHGPVPRRGGREVVLIGGEAGAGKTRLAAEFARRCHDSGAIVLLGTCDEELALPYQPWVHALDHLLRSLPGFGRPLDQRPGSRRSARAAAAARTAAARPASPGGRGSRDRAVPAVLRRRPCAREFGSASPRCWCCSTTCTGRAVRHSNCFGISCVPGRRPD